MLHVFSTNRVKLVARTPTTTIKKGQRKYVSICCDVTTDNIYSKSRICAVGFIVISVIHGSELWCHLIRIRDHRSYCRVFHPKGIVQSRNEWKYQSAKKLVCFCSIFMD